MKKIVLGLGGGAVVALGLAAAAVYGVNYYKLQHPVDDVLGADERNAGIEVSLHYENWVIPSVLVFDLKELPGDKSPLDLMRVLFQTAAVLQYQDFEEVHLSFRGDLRFKITGGYFNTLGLEYRDQNPIYTLRTFPEKVMKPDGTMAFGTWTGGILGVTGRQMEDLKDFVVAWASP